FGRDDFVVGAFQLELAGARDLHFLGESTADAEIHFDFTTLAFLAAGPLLQFFGFAPPAEHGFARCVEYPFDLKLFHGLDSFPSNWSNLSKLKFQPAEHSVIH